MRLAFVLAAALACTAAGGAQAASHKKSADGKAAPACAAVSFRPLTGAMNDGQTTSGHYKSRFGSIDLIADVKGGAATYFTKVNNKPLVALQGDIPKSVYPCLNSKHVKTPPQSIKGACTGSRFRVVVDSSTKQKLIMLFGLHGDDWKLCEAGTPG